MFPLITRRSGTGSSGSIEGDLPVPSLSGTEISTSSEGGSSPAVIFGSGGGRTVVIPSGHLFAGRTAGGGTRAEIYGTSQYGSGYLVLEPQDGDSHFISGQSFGLGMARATSIQLIMVYPQIQVDLEGLWLLPSFRPISRARILRTAFFQTTTHSLILYPKSSTRVAGPASKPAI